ncbi:MAG: zinc ribbon domain-containing protein, partial [Lachnospiraceae bacterium]|nr:zinc ribbon domain-containing protein [Lachnospiraceae bacterium]
MANYIECPNCKQKVPAGDSFCNYCGVKLPEGPVMSDDPAPSEGVIKRCRNGHEFNDPELDFCPICGFPLETVG